jgi:hypothetical protein
VLRHCKPLDWAPRLSDWGELASALYEYRGWGRDIFRLDYGYVEGGQHDAALDGLAAAHTLEYLYSEFDDGKREMKITPSELWLGVKARVDLDSRRWFPQSATHFSREVNRLKQALAYKGFAVESDSIGRGKDKKRAIRITRLDEAGTVNAGGDGKGTVNPEVTVPAGNRIDKPKSAPPEEVGTVGTVNSTSFSGNKEKNRGRKKKRRKSFTVPTVPTPEKTGESGLPKPNGAGTVNGETTVPLPSPGDSNYKRVTRENLDDYLKELEDES